MALAKAGAASGTATSPTPPISLTLSIISTEISGEQPGKSKIRARSTKRKSIPIQCPQAEMGEASENIAGELGQNRRHNANIALATPDTSTNTQDALWNPRFHKRQQPDVSLGGLAPPNRYPNRDPNFFGDLQFFLDFHF